MAFTKLTGKPLAGSEAYSDSIDGGRSGGFSHIYTSTLSDNQAAMAEILDEWPLGTAFSDQPWAPAVIIGRDIRPYSDSAIQGSPYIITISVGYRNGARTDINFDVLDEWTFQYSSSLSSAETNVNHDGSEFITAGTLDSDAEATPSSGPPYTAFPKVAGTVQKQFPSITISVEGKASSNPFSTFVSKIGTLNNSSVTMDGQTYSTRTLMLVAANSRSPDGGNNYIVNYEFEYRQNPYDFEAVVVATNPKTGQPWQGIESTVYSDGVVVPSGGTADTDKGSVGFQIYSATDFSGLGNFI